MRLLALAMLMVLAGCAATGMRYPEYAATLPDLPPSHLARLIVFRTADHSQYSGRSATVRIDGKERGSCDFAGYQIFHVPAGPHVLSAEMWDAPGKCSLDIDVLGGEEYFFELVPRTDSAAAAMLGTAIGLLAPPIGVAIGPFATMGSESASQRCGGAFSVIDVEENIALGRLHNLRMSR